MARKRGRGRNVRGVNSKAVDVPKVRDLLQEEHATGTTGQSRYSKRIRKQFQPFTIPLARSSKVIQHGRTKVAKEEDSVDGDQKPAKSTIQAEARRKGKGMVQESKAKKIIQQKVVAVVEKTRKRKNDLLKPRLEIEDFVANPYLYSPKAPKFVSVTSYSRIQAHRLVIQKDIDKIRQVAFDKYHFNISALEWPFCASSKLTAEGEAVLTEDQKLLKLIDDLKKNDKVARTELEPVLLSEQSCGQMNIHMLGHATANIQMTRGGREGVNALLNSSLAASRSLFEQRHIFVRCNISFDTLAYLQKTHGVDLSEMVYRAVRYGHRHLAAYIIKAFSSYNFNDLHIATLKNNTQPLKKFMPISVTKKGRLNRDITPLHTAAINPNVNYLKALLAVGQQYGPDLDGWDLIHYAAVCEGTGPLKHLLSMGVSPIVVNKKKQMPLHCAARAGRAENVKILINAMERHEESMRLQQSQVEAEQPLGEDTQTEDEGNGSQEEPPVPAPPPPKRRKKGAVEIKLALINAKAIKGKTPLHMAASRGHNTVVEILLNIPAVLVDTQTSATDKKLTPLMIACARGYLDVANTLIDVGGAVIEKGDKLKRTPLTHAVINGQVHIVAMLLRRGASPFSADTSGNTPAHYAAAFGWFECLTLLAKADSNCLSSSNDWHLTPLSVAYMKGHYGIMEWLVDGPYSNIVNINCRDQSGSSLLSSVIKSYNSFTDKKILSQLQFLIGKGSDCSLKDTALNTPLHYFCAIKCKLHVEKTKDDDVDEEENKKRLTKDEYRRCFDLLLANGAKLLDKNDEKYDALHLAIESGNLFLEEMIFGELLVKDPTLKSLDGETNAENKEDCFLHSLVSLPFRVYDDEEIWARKHEPCGGQYNIIPLLDKLLSHDRQKVQRWLWQRDKSGRTPLLVLCEQYADIQGANSGNKHKEKSLKQFLSTMCAVVRRLVSLDPKIMLQTVVIDSANVVPDASVRHQRETDSDDSDYEYSDDGDEDEDDESSSTTANENEQPERKDNKEKKGRSVFSYALQTDTDFRTPVITIEIGGETYNITNKLLITLIEAAKENHLLLELLNQRDADGYTPLLRMISAKNLVLSMYLLRAAHSVATVESGEKVDAAKVSLRYCTEKKRYVPWKKTVLMFAVENSMFKLIEELDLTMTEWNACTAAGSTAFHFAAKIVSFKSVALYELLKQKGVEQKANEHGRYPLHHAVASLSKTDVDVLTEPLDWFTKNEAGMYMKDKYGFMPLHYCFVPLEPDIFAKMTIDPVAILSVLLSVMQKNMINKADNYGYTALHYAALYGANICTVTLLQAGADQNVLNNDGNSPLALAVLRKNEACTLTLIQAKSDVVREVFLVKKEKKEKKRKDQWIWIPRRPAAEKIKPPATIPSLIVRNEWQGIVYVLLNVMGKSVRTVGSLVRAALEHRKYNLAQTLLGMFRILLQDEPPEKITSTLEDLDLFYVFVENLTTNEMDGSISKILDSLLLLGCKWYTKQKDGFCQSRVVECLASNGHFKFMDALHELDQKSARPIWDSINYELNNNNPLVGIIETWIKHGPIDGIKFWLKHFAGKFGINSLMLYQRPAFDGMIPCLPKRPVSEFCYMTSLIRAIQCSRVGLVEFLLQEADLRTDVNKPDEFGITPLMHACMVNSEIVIQLLFDPNALQEQKKNSRNTTAVDSTIGTVINAGIGGLFGGFGNYGDVVNQSTDDNAQSSTSRSSQVKANEKNTKKKFILKSNLDPFKQGIITGRLGSDERRSRNFIHFMLEPCGWENVDLLQEICRSIPQVENLIKQPSSQAADSTPMHTARACRQACMLAAMKKLAGTNNDLEVEYPAIDVSSVKTQYDIDTDCERFLARDAEARRERMKREFTKSFLKPHQNSGYRDSGEICMKQLENSESIPYKVLLTKTDVSRGYYGFHNYYRMELIKRKGSELYVLFTNWGRIGDSMGQYQRTPFGTMEEADKEFSAIFRSKTGNEFADIKNFDEKPMKYRLLKVDSDTSGNIADLEIDFKKSTSIDRRAAESSIYKLIEDISNVKRLQKRTRTVSQHQRSRIPFGCISRSDLLEAQKVLTKLRNLKKEMDNCNRMVKGSKATLKILEGQAQATNEFYRLMPLGGFENGTLQMIDNEYMFNECEEIIERLFGMEIAGKLLTAAAYNMDRVDPYMYISDALECELTLLDPNDLMTQRILQNIQITSSCSVEGIYAVKSRDAAEAFNNNALEVGNHRYLWHGTKPENMLSILKVGLLASPAFAVQTGQAFGQGIYFADVFKKSEGYCTPSNSGFKYIMLCEVALGEIYYGAASHSIRYDQDDKLARFDTLKVIGQQEPDPLYDMTMDNGCVLPLGDLINIDGQEVLNRYQFYPCTNYNEYVVRDKTLTLVRYLVVFR